MVMSRWDPFADLVSLREAMSSLFDQSFVRPTRGAVPEKAAARVLPIDLYERENDYVIRAYVPGAKADDVEINADQGTLIIKARIPGERDTDEAKSYKWLISELVRGDVARAIAHPARIDMAKIEAGCENGILTVTVPKAEEVKPKKITVKEK